MVAAELRSTGSLGEVLSARARRTPRDRLVVDLIGGSLVAVVASWARPGGWLVWATAGACLAMYGTWAIAERQLLPRPWPEQARFARAWRAVQQVSAVLGLVAFAVFLFAALGVALGPMKL